MKSNLKTLAFLLIFSLPSVVLGKTFTNCGGDFNGFLKEAESYAMGIGVSPEVVNRYRFRRGQDQDQGAQAGVPGHEVKPGVHI